ncbi:hypothetical protein QQ045_028741 [Rhodiola kirilowii]
MVQSLVRSAKSVVKFFLLNREHETACEAYDLFRKCRGDLMLFGEGSALDVDATLIQWPTGPPIKCSHSTTDSGFRIFTCEMRTLTLRPSVESDQETRTRVLVWTKYFVHVACYSCRSR